MCVCVVLYGAVEHWLSGTLINVVDDDDDDDEPLCSLTSVITAFRSITVVIVAWQLNLGPYAVAHNNPGQIWPCRDTA